MNINGYCPHCKVNLDGDLVINYPLSQGKTKKQAIQYASCYAGWTEHGELNRWGKQIGNSSIEYDRITYWECPDCKKTWKK